MEQQSYRKLSNKQLRRTLESIQAECEQTDQTEIASLLREVEACQIELELQSRALRSSQLQLEVARDRYRHLYDYAPVGYLTLNRSGVLLQANLTAANLLGQEQSAVIGALLAGFVTEDSAQQLQEHLDQTFGSLTKQTVKLNLAVPNEQIRPILLISEPVAAKYSGGEYCRSVAVDMLDHALAVAEEERVLEVKARPEDLELELGGAKLHAKVERRRRRERRKALTDSHVQAS